MEPEAPSLTDHILQSLYYYSGQSLERLANFVGIHRDVTLNLLRKLHLEHKVRFNDEEKGWFLSVNHRNQMAEGLLQYPGYFCPLCGQWNTRRADTNTTFFGLAEDCRIFQTGKCSHTLEAIRAWGDQAWPTPVEQKT